MPIWFELMVLLLVTYIIGFGTGWIIWVRNIAGEPVGETSEPIESENSP